MSVQPDGVLEQMRRILKEESSLLADLEVLLGKEAGVLQGNDVKAIEQIGANRHDCVAALMRLEAERSSACKMLSFGQGPAAFEKLMRWCDRSGALRRQWQANLVAARRCQNINDRNGAVVKVKLGRVQKLLATVRGSETPPVYGRRGARYGAVAVRDLGQA
jgi:flagellar biosynthesis/type III secretory pathway chaperone